MATGVRFPPPRERVRETPDPPHERYASYESFEFSPLTASFVEGGRFSGRPDQIEVQAIVSDSRVRIRRRGEAQAFDMIVLLSGDIQRTFVTGEIVEVARFTGGSASTVQVVGKWRSRAPDRSAVTPTEAPAPAALD